MHTCVSQILLPPRLEAHHGVILATLTPGLLHDFLQGVVIDSVFDLPTDVPADKDICRWLAVTQLNSKPAYICLKPHASGSWQPSHRPHMLHMLSSGWGFFLGDAWLPTSLVL